MTDRINVYPAGSILTMTEGSYSDYGICEQLLALTECDMPALAKEYSDSIIAKDRWAECNGFCAWLVSTGKCTPMDLNEVHIEEWWSLDD